MEKKGAFYEKNIITVLALTMLCGCSAKTDDAGPESSGDAMFGSSASSKKIAEIPVSSSELKQFSFGSAEEVEAVSDKDLIYIAQKIIPRQASFPISTRI